MTLTNGSILLLSFGLEEGFEEEEFGRRECSLRIFYYFSLWILVKSLWNLGWAVALNIDNFQYYTCQDAYSYKGLTISKRMSSIFWQKNPSNYY